MQTISLPLSLPKTRHPWKALVRFLSKRFFLLIRCKYLWNDKTWGCVLKFIGRGRTWIFAEDIYLVTLHSWNWKVRNIFIIEAGNVLKCVCKLSKAASADDTDFRVAWYSLLDPVQRFVVSRVSSNQAENDLSTNNEFFVKISSSRAWVFWSWRHLLSITSKNW